MKREIGKTTFARPASPRELKKFFDRVAQRMEILEIPSQARLKVFFKKIESRIATAERQQQKIDRREATRFNILSLVEPDECKLSDILAMLLDPQGDHGQRDDFLRLFLKRLSPPPWPKASTNVKVQREAPTSSLTSSRRRMDILVEAGFVVAVENKIDSGEQQDQVKDYLEHLQRCAAKTRRRHLLIYLTPNGRNPDSLTSSQLSDAKDRGQLRCWSYQDELLAWLEDCRCQCSAPKVRYFLSDLISYIKTDLKRKTQIEQYEYATR